MADCGLRRIEALTGIGRIADCTLGTLRCKDASCWVLQWLSSIPILGTATLLEALEAGTARARERPQD
eukprot:3944836-Alexandrium_andersonii.AAC.1